MNATQQVIDSILKEDTGSHFLDSGGTPSFDADGKYVGSEHGYGRGHEKNRGRDFMSEPHAVVQFDCYEIQDGSVVPEIYFQHNAFHWLSDRLEFAEEYDTMFHEEYVPEVDPDDDMSWLGLMDGFAGWLRDRGHEATGLYGEGDPFTVNTYNGEDLVNQVIQYVYMEVDDEGLVVIQTQNGCDVRGGYSKPRLFFTDEDIFMNADGMIACPNGHYWVTDDGCHWYDEGCAGYSAGRQLEEYSVRRKDDLTKKEVEDLETKRYLADHPTLPSIETPEDPTNIGIGFIMVDGYDGYCPKCGAKLEAH